MTLLEITGVGDESLDKFLRRMRGRKFMAQEWISAPHGRTFLLMSDGIAMEFLLLAGGEARRFKRVPSGLVMFDSNRRIYLKCAVKVVSSTGYLSFNAQLALGSWQKALRRERKVLKWTQLNARLDALEKGIAELEESTRKLRNAKASAKVVGAKVAA